MAWRYRPALPRRGARRGRQRCRGRRASGPLGAARDPHALAVTLELDLGEAGLLQQLGEIADEVVIDRGFGLGHIGALVRCRRCGLGLAFGRLLGLIVGAARHGSGLGLGGGERGQPRDGEAIALDPEAAQRGPGDRRDVGVMAEMVAGEDIADMDLDHRKRSPPRRRRGSRPTCGYSPRVEHDAGRLLGCRFVDPVDQIALVVRLAGIPGRACAAWRARRKAAPGPSWWRAHRFCGSRVPSKLRLGPLRT